MEFAEAHVAWNPWQSDNMYNHLRIEAGADFVQGYYFGVPRPSLVQDPMAVDLICRLKRLRTVCEAEPGDCSPETVAGCIGKLLAAGRAMGAAG